MTTPNLPVNRIREFLVSHGRMEGGDRERIAQVYHYDGKGPARLNAGDLLFLLDCLDRIRNLAYRAVDADEPMAEIFKIAAGMPPLMALPPHGRPRPVSVNPDGTVGSADFFPDPFEGGGGTMRTRTCAHCWRRCGDAAGGAGVVNAVPVCAAPEAGRPDCYQQIVEHAHGVHGCEVCRVAAPPLPDGLFEDALVGRIRIRSNTPTKLGPSLPITHIKQIGSRLNLCPNRGVGAQLPSQATCSACREIYAASGDDDRSRHAPDTI